MSYRDPAISQKAVRARVIRIARSLILGHINEDQAQTSIEKWWDSIAPADRPLAGRLLGAECRILRSSASATAAAAEKALQKKTIHGQPAPTSKKGM